jgi:lipopolysaccharide biosynthesis regulator YciM
MRRALLAVLDRDFESAERALVDAVREDSGAVEAYVAVARLYRGRGEIGRAIRIHQNLLLRPDLDPALRVDVLAELAADFQRGGFLRRAIASWDEVLAHDPRRRDALRALVQLSADVHEFDRAAALARRLARAEGRDPAPEEIALGLRRARSAHAEGRHDEARKALRRVLRKDRRNARARLLLGELEAERGRSKAALAAWEPVPELDRSLGPEVYPRLAATYAALGRPRDFERLLRRLLETRPDDVGARVALAGALAARGDAAEAVAELRRAVDRDPADLLVRVALGRLLLSERRDPEAQKEYAELLEMLEARETGTAGALREELE